VLSHLYIFDKLISFRELRNGAQTILICGHFFFLFFAIVLQFVISSLCTSSIFFLFAIYGYALGRILRIRPGRQRHFVGSDFVQSREANAMLIYGNTDVSP